jgi:hypothetical protein
MERETGFELLGAFGHSQPSAAPPSAWECDEGLETALVFASGVETDLSHRRFGGLLLLVRHTDTLLGVTDPGMCLLD